MHSRVPAWVTGCPDGRVRARQVHPQTRPAGSSPLWGHVLTHAPQQSITSSARAGGGGGIVMGGCERLVLILVLIKKRPPSRRSFLNPIKYLDQEAAIATEFFRLLRQPSSPNAPRPVAKSGSAAGRGVVDGAIEVRRRLSPSSPLVLIVEGATPPGAVGLQQLKLAAHQLKSKRFA